MKNLLWILCAFYSLCSVGQITLEHDYNENGITRVNLEYSGEKYYLIDPNYSYRFLKLYNADHSLWRTITLPIDFSLSPPLSIVPTRILHISESKINPDMYLEIVLSCYDYVNNKYVIKVFSDNGTNYLAVNDADNATFSEIQGFDSKLIISRRNASESIVYSIPNLTPENVYPSYELKRKLFQNFGPKYYFLDKSNQILKLFNENFILWKTINLPIPVNGSYISIGFISENGINTDNLIEVGYTYYINSSQTFYEGKVVNENNDTLLTIPEAKSMYINTLEYVDNRLMVNKRSILHPNPLSTAIYTVPELNLDTTYDGVVYRVSLENSGEKYYKSYPITNNQTQVYNSDYTFWKNIPTPSNWGTLDYVDNLSETTINADDLLEYSVTSNYFQEGGGTYSTQLFNENGTLYQTISGAQKVYFSNLPGLQTKLIADKRSLYSSLWTYKGSVYSLNPQLSTEDFNNKNTSIILAPNPAVTHFSINCEANSIKQVAVYNYIGELIHKETASKITLVNTEKFSPGIYIIKLTDENNLESYQRMIVSE